MLYPVSQLTTNNYIINKKRILYNKQAHSGVVFRGDDIGNTDDVKQKNSKRNFWLIVILAYLTSATIIASKSFASVSNGKGAARRVNDVKPEMTKFVSLANDENIPTLKTCKSINKRLREILETKILYKDVDKELLNECGMPQSSNRFLFYGDPGNGKSFFSKIYAKSIDAEYKEIAAPDFQKRFIGESLEGLENIFEDSLQIAKQNPNKEYVLVLNEADQLIFSADKLKETSGGYGFFRLDMRDIFINYLDKLKDEAPNVTFIGTVNFTPTDGALDRAILSRFSKNIVEVPYPEANALYEALKANLKGLAGYETWISKNDEKLLEIAKDMEKRQCSFRNLDNIIDIAKETNLKNRMQDRNKQFDVRYISDALSKIEHTDGEISAAQKMNTKR